MKGNKLISLSQREILGFNDEYININVTKCKKYFYFLIGNYYSVHGAWCLRLCKSSLIQLMGIFFYYSLLTASFGYLINGFFVGWSSNFFTFDETDEFYNVSFSFFFCYYSTKCTYCK